ncbi:MAG: DUF4430 domain-containing protein [Lachnospiraceae bacterium]|nr:DUF4430 domain-containing protein [Lachnospiraceae bacterium]
MTKKQKIRIIAIFAAIIIIAAGTAVFLNVRETQEGTKSFQVVISSERDDFQKTTDEKSDLLFLGEFLRLMEGCEYEESDFGLFINGFYGMEQDFSREYWWLISVNGEGAMVGVDDIPILDGDVYSFTLIQGWDY